MYGENELKASMKPDEVIAPRKYGVLLAFVRHHIQIWMHCSAHKRSFAQFHSAIGVDHDF
jgi:hypothetical protein